MAGAVLYLNRISGTKGPQYSDRFAKPAKFESPVNGKDWGFGDVVQCLAAHLAKEIGTVDAALRTDGFPTHAQWTESISPLVELAALLQAAVP